MAPQSRLDAPTLDSLLDEAPLNDEISLDWLLAEAQLEDAITLDSLIAEAQLESVMHAPAAEAARDVATWQRAHRAAVVEKLLPRESFRSADDHDDEFWQVLDDIFRAAFDAEEETATAAADAPARTRRTLRPRMSNDVLPHRRSVVMSAPRSGKHAWRVAV